jgi:hypothetical protein
MPKKQNSAIQTGPLSVGNVVSAGLRIYRDRFKSYFGLAFVAYLWLLVPIYGWAKYSAISALISRLAFGEVRENPETVSEVRQEVNPRMWSFLWAGVLTSLIFFGVSLIGGFCMAFLVIGAGTIWQNSPIISVLFIAVAVIAFLIIYIRIISRLFIVELPLAIESDVDASSAIGRSWQLTKGAVGRIQWIVLVAFLISLPFTIVVSILSSIVQAFLGTFLDPKSSLFFVVYYIVTLPLSFGSGALVTPFWQAIKAVLYYDLRSRKEGLGLQMRDSR